MLTKQRKKNIKNQHLSHTNQVLKLSSVNKTDHIEIEKHLIASHVQSIEIAEGAVEILRNQKSLEELDLRSYSAILDDTLLTELAHQIQFQKKQWHDNNEQTSLLYSKIVLSGCDKFTDIGMRAFAYAIGDCIIELDYSRTIIPTPVLKVFANGIEKLEILNLMSCNILNGQQLREFITCCNQTLSRLNLSYCKSLTDDALGWIAGTLGVHGSLTCCRKLVSLDISFSTGIRDQGLIALGMGCRALLYINLDGLPAITDQGTLGLLKGCRNLRVISMRSCLRLTDTTLSNIGKYACKLQSLNVSGCYSLSSRGLLPMLYGTPYLQSLFLEGCLRVGEDILEVVAKNCLSIQVLNVNGCQQITDNGINTLSEHLPYVCLATTYRGLAPKDNVIQLKFSTQMNSIRNSAALQIQSLYRGYLGRKLAKNWRIDRIEAPASLCIRRAYMTYKLKKEIRLRTDKSIERYRSATIIQSRFRGRACRKMLYEIRKEKEKLAIWSVKAVKIQAVYKSYFVRNHMLVISKTLKRYRRERCLIQWNIAAAKLQRAYRMRFRNYQLEQIINFHRKRREDMETAATILQRIFRSRLARQGYQHLQLAMQKHEAELRRHSMYATIIQRLWRGHCVRFYVEQLRIDRRQTISIRYNAASCINACVRFYLARRLMHKARVRREREEAAANVLRLAWRRFVAGENYSVGNIVKLVDHINGNMVHEVNAAAARVEALLRRGRYSSYAGSASDSDSGDDWQEYMDASGYEVWFSSSQNKWQYVRPNNNAKAKSVLGMTCRVFWKKEQNWFEGKIVRFSSKNQRHKVDYGNDDREWVHLFTSDCNRVQLWTGGCWCLAKMYEPSLRTQRASVFLLLKFQKYDADYFIWRSGIIKAYHEGSNSFLLSYDMSDSNSGTVYEEWWTIAQLETVLQVKNNQNGQWYSMSSYVFGAARGLPLTGTPDTTGMYYTLEDYLSWDGKVDFEAIVNSADPEYHEENAAINTPETSDYTSNISEHEMSNSFDSVSTSPTAILRNI